MGTAIKGVFEAKIRDHWQSTGERYYNDRDLIVQSWLGLDLWAEAIDDFRGFPPDWISAGRGVGPIDGPPAWRSWLLADEILEAIPVITTESVLWPKPADINRRIYAGACDTRDSRDWPRPTFIAAQPRPFKEGYTDDKWGFDLYWDSTYEPEVQAFLAIIRRLKEQYKELRLVFWHEYT